MSSGFVPGVFWGVVVSATCLVIASQSQKVVDLSPEPVVEADASVNAAESKVATDAADAASRDEVETQPGTDMGSTNDAAEEGPTDASDPMPDGATDEATDPQAGAGGGDGTADEATDSQTGDGTDAAVEASDTDADVETEEATPEAGTGEEESRDAAPQPGPGDRPETDVASDAVGDDETAAAEEEALRDDTEPAEETPVVSATAPEASAPAVTQAEPAAETPDVIETEPVEAAPVVGETETAEDAPVVSETEVAQTTPEAVETEPEQPAATDVAADTGSEPDTPPVIVLDAPDTAREPEGGLGDLAENVTTNRLPRIGDTEDVAATGDEAIEAPAIERNAVPFEAAPGVPLLSIVLVDTGADRPAFDKFADFPMPLTIAIDPLRPDAAAVAERYRAAGHEVAVLTPLAEGALPEDVAEAFEVFLAAVPQAVAVMDLPEALLQANRARATQVSTILQRSGHGLITYDRGFNSGVQIADGDGVPAKLVFRVFDNGTQTLAAMRQVLDNSVLGAGQQGAAILVGQTREESLQALAEWVLGTRGASVSPAPVSAALKM